MDNSNQQENETPVASPAEQKTPVITETENALSASQPTQEQPKTEEEAAWDALKGSTQERIKQILRERDELKNLVTTQKPPVSNPAPAYQQPSAPSEEIRQAAKLLTTEGNLVSREEFDALWFTIDKEKKHDRLAGKYTGADGLPKYDRQEVEDYMNRKKIWDPEVAFRDMYFDEFVDSRKSQNNKVYTEKPTAAAGREEPMTIESLREKLRGPNGREVYEKFAKNPQKFDELLRQLSE